MTTAVPGRVNVKSGKTLSLRLRLRSKSGLRKSAIRSLDVHSAFTISFTLCSRFVHQG